VRSDGWYENETTTFIAMEYMHLGDLERYLSKPFAEIETTVIIRQVVEAICHMHENGFIHRDVKARVQIPLPVC
jgi:serine/threonine protein kinase